MTYRELLKELKRMSDEQLDLDVVFHDTVDGEYYQADIDAADEVVSEDHLGAPWGVPHPVIVHTSHIETEESS